MNRLQKILLALLSLCAIVAGLSLGKILRDPQGNALPDNSSIIGQHRPDFSLADLNGQIRSISEWDGQPLIINFWATWCAPCREEIPAFIKIREQYAPQGLEIIGVAIDLPDMVNDFAGEMKIPYPLLIGNEDASEISLIYGNRIGTLPYTVFIDRQGKVKHVHSEGALDETTLNTLLERLLKS